MAPWYSRPREEISARVGRVTGRGISGNIARHYSPWMLQGMVLLLFTANVVAFFIGRDDPDVEQNETAALASEIKNLRAEIAAPSQALAAVHAAVREQVPMMEVDREVAEQIATVDELLPALAGVAAAHCGDLR